MGKKQRGKDYPYQEMKAQNVATMAVVVSYSHVYPEDSTRPTIQTGKKATERKASTAMTETEPWKSPSTVEVAEAAAAVLVRDDAHRCRQ